MLLAVLMGAPPAFGYISVHSTLYTSHKNAEIDLRLRPSRCDFPSMSMSVCGSVGFANQGISMKREFRVCDEQDTIHVREDISQGGDSMSHKEAHIPKKFVTSSK